MEEVVCFADASMLKMKFVWLNLYGTRHGQRDENKLGTSNNYFRTGDG